MWAALKKLKHLLKHLQLKHLHLQQHLHLHLQHLQLKHQQQHLQSKFPFLRFLMQKRQNEKFCLFFYLQKKLKGACLIRAAYDAKECLPEKGKLLLVNEALNLEKTKKLPHTLIYEAAFFAFMLRRQDSNLQLPDPESGALPIWPLLNAEQIIFKKKHYSNSLFNQFIFR